MSSVYQLLTKIISDISDKDFISKRIKMSFEHTLRHWLKSADVARHIVVAHCTICDQK